MEFDFNNKRDRIIIYIEGRLGNETIFDINSSDKTTVYDTSIELQCKLAVFILNEFKDHYYHDKVFCSVNDIREAVKEVIEDKRLYDDDDLDSMISAVTTIIKHSVPCAYKVNKYNVDYNDSNEETEVVSYNTDETYYLEMENIQMYKVQNKSIYVYDNDKQQYTDKVAQLF